MVTFIICIIFILWALACPIIGKYDRNNDYKPTMAWLLGFAAIFFIATIVIGFVANYEQLDRIETVTEKTQNIQVYEQKADELISQFTVILETKYPDFEKQIFDDMSPEQVEILFVKYPELKTSETLITLVNKIAEYKSSIYTEKILINGVNKGIRVAKRNLWNVRFMLPKN